MRREGRENYLDAFIARRTVNCVPVSLDRYVRTVASCSVGDVDLGEWLVRNGFALDWPHSEANAAVKSIDPKAMTLILTSDEERDVWMRAPPGMGQAG